MFIVLSPGMSLDAFLSLEVVLVASEENVWGRGSSFCPVVHGMSLINQKIQVGSGIESLGCSIM